MGAIVRHRAPSMSSIVRTGIRPGTSRRNFSGARRVIERQELHVDRAEPLVAGRPASPRPGTTLAEVLEAR